LAVSNEGIQDSAKLAGAGVGKLFHMTAGPLTSPLFPYTTLFRSDDRDLDRDLVDRAGRELLVGHLEAPVTVDRPHRAVGLADLRDRKSTRLNSSHVKISYAVFCLKKKKNLT